MPLPLPPTGAPSPDRARPAGLLDLLAVSVLGAALSLLVTGHVSGTGNNVFHLGIMAGLRDEPQFAGDPFIQSLRHFASGFWWPFAGRVTSDAYQPLFLVLAFLSRVLTFLGFLLCAATLGLRSRRQRLVLALLLVYPATMRGISVAGGGGLFLDGFTQSEVANGTTLLMLAAAARRRLAVALALNGVTFFINAFIAVWNLVPLGLIVATLLARRHLAPGPALRQGLAGLLAFGLAAAPVVAAVRDNPAFGVAPGFDYVAFLRLYYPQHFLIDSIPPSALGLLLSWVLAGAVSAYWLTRTVNVWLVALCGFALVWLAGAALPWLTHSPALLNLHLLRSSGSLQLLVTFATASLAALWLTGSDREQAGLWGPLAAFALTAAQGVLVPAMIPLAWASRRPRVPAAIRLPQIHRWALALAALSVLELAIRQNREAAERRGEVAAWRAVGLWARAATPPEAVFLLPCSRGLPGHEFPLCRGSEVFQFHAHRRVWVDFKSGAAVMWFPPYYATWYARLAETFALDGVPARLAYARQHGIGYVIEACPAPAGTERPVFASGALCVFAAPDRAASGR